MRTLLLVVLVSGCWRSGDPEVEAPARRGRTQVEVNLAMMTVFRDRMCECASRPCLDGVQAAMSAWVEDKMAQPQRYEPPPSDEMLARITQVGLSMSECASRVLTARASR
jgi:hypothetical protein